MADELDEKDSQQEQKGPAMPIGMPMWPMQPSPVPAAVPIVPGASPMPTAPAAGTAAVQPKPMPAAPTLPTPQKSAIAKLWDKTGDIQNPFAKILARAGTGVLGGLEAVGESAFPSVAMMVPHSILGTKVENRQADKRAETQAAMGQAERKTAAEEQAVAQKPELAQQAGELKGKLEAEKEAEAEKRQQAGFEQQNKALGERQSAAESAAADREAGAEKRQQAQFAEQEKLEGLREAAAEKRITQKQQTEKVTADEQRRADLAENLNENLDSLEDIVKRRPELFGPLAGRWAELKQKFGSDDPDLGKLQTIEHQIGMAQISAHGMRSAQGVQGAADSILNNLHSGPGAMMASIGAVRDSVKTFTQDVESKKGGAAKNPDSKGGKAKPKDFGAAPAGKAEGSTGALPDGTKVVIKGGRIVAQ